MISVGPAESSRSNWGIFYSNDERKTPFPYYIPTGEIFNDDPPFLIRLKCIALVGLTPLTSIARSIYWFSLSFFSFLSEAYCYLDGKDSSPKDVSAMKKFGNDSLRAWDYGVLMTGCACMGIIDPFLWRLRYGHLERELHHHVDGPHRDRFYLAKCFQRIANLTKNGQDNSQKAAAKCNKFLTLVDAADAMRSAAFAFSPQQFLLAWRKVQSLS